MKGASLQGKRSLRVGRIYGLSPHTRNYCLHFFTDEVRVAMVHWHHSAKQLVVNPLEVCLTRETLIGLGQYLDIKVFRLQRRLGMSRIRNAVKARMKVRIVE